jgi:hypothetical protein
MPIASRTARAVPIPRRWAEARRPGPGRRYLPLTPARERRRFDPGRATVVISTAAVEPRRVMRLGHRRARRGLRASTVRAPLPTQDLEQCCAGHDSRPAPAAVSRAKTSVALSTPCADSGPSELSRPTEEEDDVRARHRRRGSRAGAQRNTVPSPRAESPSSSNWTRSWRAQEELLAPLRAPERSALVDLLARLTRAEEPFDSWIGEAGSAQDGEARAKPGHGPESGDRAP